MPGATVSRTVEPIPSAPTTRSKESVPPSAKCTVAESIAVDTPVALQPRWYRSGGRRSSRARYKVFHEVKRLWVAAASMMEPARSM